MDSDKMFEIIKWWHYKAWDEDYFSKYVFEYLAFIWYIQKYKYLMDNDRSTIQLLKKDEEIKKNYLELVNQNDNLKDSWYKIMEELKRSPLWRLTWSGRLLKNDYWNCSHDKYKEKTDEEIQKPTWVIHNLEDWENMVEFWYTIRNTLFHWWKNANDRRDLLLIEYGYKTLRPLVDLLIN